MDYPIQIIQLDSTLMDGRCSPMTLSRYQLQTRIESVLYIRCPKRQEKTTFRNGISHKISKHFTWKFVSHRETKTAHDFAYLVPSGYSCRDIRQETDALYAAVGMPVVIRDRGGVVVISISKFDFPTTIPFQSEMLSLTKGREILVGYTPDGQPVIHSFRVPHLLIGGQSGYGKTDLIRLILLQLIHHFTPDQLWIDIVDGKGFSFLPFRGIPHIRRIVRDLGGAYTIMKEARQLMEKRSTEVWNSGDRDITNDFQWRIVLIDELAVISPSMQTTKEAKETAMITYSNMCAVACVGREASVGMIMGTQRPDVSVVHPQVKQNCDVSIAFRCKTLSNSEVILDRGGAENLPLGVAGRAIYAGLEDATFQVPFVGKDDKWDELLKPYREGHNFNGKSDSIEAGNDNESVIELSNRID
jgi:S-DNA-T family DNA segregation ATPase FtsK/SpoIIIE